MPGDNQEPWSPERVLVTYTRDEGIVEILREHRPDLDLRSRQTTEVTVEDLDWAQVYIGFRKPNHHTWGGVRWIHSTGAGVDRFLFRADLSPDILLTRSSEDFGPQIGEYCVARALAVTQRLREFRIAQDARVWSNRIPDRLAGSRVVVVGTGQVGRGVADAFTRMDCVVDGVSRSGAPRDPFRVVTPWSEFPSVIEGAQWLVLAAPLTEESWHLLDDEMLSMCDGVYLINVARGALVDEASLPLALDRGWLSGAALDVFETEPLPSTSPLWEHPGVVISPHCSGVTDVRAAAEGFLECLDALERGEMPDWVIDREAGY